MSLVFLRCLWLMEHQKPIWAQCDAFLRTRVCQGHTNIINEQEADWRETEQREKRPRKQTGRLYLCLSVIWCIFTCGSHDDCLGEATLSDGGAFCAQRSPVITYHQFVYKWMAAPFFFFLLKIHLEKSHLPLLFHAQWQRTRKCIKQTSPLMQPMCRRLYLSECGALCCA